jgi:excisionase family DNA binding protein
MADAERDFFTAQEVADHFQVTPRTIRRWLLSGELDGTQPGGVNGRIRINRQSLLTQIELSLKRPSALAEQAEEAAEAAESARTSHGYGESKETWLGRLTPDERRTYHESTAAARADAERRAALIPAGVVRA